MQGFVDASADTQWLRILPAREQLAQSPVKPEMEVTLEHVETGNSVVMDDSLFEDQRGLHFVNVWSKMEVEPGQTYHLTAKQPEGSTSSVSVSTPNDFPMPTFTNSSNGCRGNLHITGVERLADVKSIWIIRFYFSDLVNKRKYIIPYRSQAYELSGDGYSVFIDDTAGELSQILNQLTTTPDSLDILQRDLFVASAGPEWNSEVASLEEVQYFLPGQFSNVENGVGYVLGIVSKTVPLDHCI